MRSVFLLDSSSFAYHWISGSLTYFDASHRNGTLVLLRMDSSKF